MLKIEWTQEKKDAVCDMLDKWLKKHGAWGGEMIMQDDNCQIYASSLISDMVDDVIKPELVDEG
jgi:hypothetical protein